MMDRILIVTPGEKSAAGLSALLRKVSPSAELTVLTSASQARRSVLDDAFDFLVVNSPLLDDSAAELCRMAALNTDTSCLLLVKEEFFEATLNECEGSGVAVVSKPVVYPVLYQSFSLLKSVKGKTDTLRHENERLRAKLEEVKLISQAKCLLIEKKGCSEEAAHHLIERRAMNSRISAKEAAGQILRIYSDN